MRIPVDLVAYVFAFLDYAADSDALFVFERDDDRKRVERVWLRYTRVEHVSEKITKRYWRHVHGGRIVSKVENTVTRCLVNGVTHSVRDEPAVVYEITIEKGRARILEWYRNGRLHRDGDLPAVVNNCKHVEMWYQNDVLHRDNGPAVMHANGAREWYNMGVLHRDDGPAVIKPDGSKTWYRMGVLHRDNDLPAVINKNGELLWYRDGRLHRDNDKPAVVKRDRHEWWRMGLRHRDSDRAAFIDKHELVKGWYQFGQLHRVDRPAKIHHMRSLEFYHNGEHHRAKGLPAEIRHTGNEVWWNFGAWLGSKTDEKHALAEIARYENESYELENYSDIESLSCESSPS